MTQPSSLSVTAIDKGDCLELFVPLPNARLRLNRFPGDPYFVEAVEFEGGEITLLSATGGSPRLDEVEYEFPFELEPRLDVSAARAALDETQQPREE